MKTTWFTCSNVILALLLVMTHTGISQPRVHIISIDSYDFPNIVIEFAVECGNNERFDLAVKNLTVLEEGKVVDSLRLVCPPPGQGRCCLSAAVLVDRAARFDDSIRYRVRDALYAFFDRFDGSCDEGTLMSVENQPAVKVFMTNDKELLKNGIDAIYSGLQTALWDGLYSTISELLNNASNLCRNILLVTSGIDGAGSDLTLDDCIRFARDNGVRVFPLAFAGDIRLDTLHAIAEATGGRVLFNPGAEGIDALYREMTTRRCRVEYLGSCADGTRREVELLIGKPEPLAHCTGIGKDSSWFYARTENKPDVLTMPDSLALDSTGNGLRPNPFSISYRLFNRNCETYFVSRSTLSLDNSDTSGVRIEDPVREIATPLDNGDSLLISWKVTVKSRTQDRMLKFAIKTMTSNGLREARDSVFIPAVSISAIKNVVNARSFRVGKLYPNPVTSVIKGGGTLFHVPVSVNTKIPVAISIINVTGAEVFAVKPVLLDPGSHVLSVPAIALRPGIYLVVIKSTIKVSVRKLLVIM